MALMRTVKTEIYHSGAIARLYLARVPFRIGIVTLARPPPVYRITLYLVEHVKLSVSDFVIALVTTERGGLKA
ncbi:hypothetical protein EVAR_62249_1 [Eumeta japonica]|uniref:Uncharacterized protein n=1 Tax=Eumeta variegata TaxID=151549 RepID=A0A4C1ZG98_EUMVA|nr:hypothetical protein EVAR_62249_1 [Eumeta japonica]